MKFRVELVGSFYTAELYNVDGDYIYDLMEAAACAESKFGADWKSVYNGNESIERDDYVN